MNTPTTTSTATNAYMTDHYMAAAKWVRGIEGMKKVQDIQVHDLYTAIAIDGSRILRSSELTNLAKLCEANGLEYAVINGSYGLMIIIDKA
jgi:hypothetical protein